MSIMLRESFAVAPASVQGLALNGFTAQSSDKLPKIAAHFALPQAAAWTWINTERRVTA
jgi:hypothetical protein